MSKSPAHQKATRPSTSTQATSTIRSIMKLLRYLAAKAGLFFHDIGVALMFFGNAGPDEFPPKRDTLHDVQPPNPWN